VTPRRHEAAPTTRGVVDMLRAVYEDKPITDEDARKLAGLGYVVYFDAQLWLSYDAFYLLGIDPRTDRTRHGEDADDTW
jgi:hypothetical protein